jgi:hypothetical protein
MASTVSVTRQQQLPLPSSPPYQHEARDKNSRNAVFSIAIRLLSAESPDFTSRLMTNIAQPFLNLRVRRVHVPHAVPDKPEAHFNCSA